MAAQRMQVASYSWIERQGLVLLNKIAPGRDGSGCWSLPGGGVVWGEEPEAAAARTVREHTGLRGEVDELLGVDSAIYEPSEVNRFTAVHAVRLIYRMTAAGKPLAPEADDTMSDAAWLPLANIDCLPTIGIVGVGRRLAQTRAEAATGFRSRRH